MKARNHVLGLLALCAIVTLFSGCASQQAPEAEKTAQPELSGYDIYENSTYGVRISYPADWEKTENFMGTPVVFLAPKECAEDRFQENLNIMTMDMSGQEATLQEYTAASEEQIKQVVTDAQITESADTTLAGSPAHRIVFSGTQGAYKLKWMQVWTIKNKKAYGITYTAEADKYDAYLDKVNKMIRSFETM